MFFVTLRFDFLPCENVRSPLIAHVAALPAILSIALLVVTVLECVVTTNALAKRELTSDVIMVTNLGDLM